MLKLKLQYFGHLMWRTLIGKDLDAGKDWRWEEKGTTEDEMAGWHHRLDGHEFEWTPGVGDGQGGLVCCCPWGHKESDTTERLSWTDTARCWRNLKCEGKHLPHGKIRAAKRKHEIRYAWERGFLGGANGKETACQGRRWGFNPWLGTIPWRKEWHPLQHSLLENPMDRGASQATVHRTAQSRTWLKSLSTRSREKAKRASDAFPPRTVAQRVAARLWFSREAQRQASEAQRFSSWNWKCDWFTVYLRA